MFSITQIRPIVLERFERRPASLRAGNKSARTDVKINQREGTLYRYQRSPQHPLTMTWREYHESTKHTVESLRRTQRLLDWANMPDPFRHYEGAPLLDLLADPPSLGIPALHVLKGGIGTTAKLT